MARKLFEEQGIRTRRGRLVPEGTVYVVYTDVAGTALADISATSGGSAIAGSAVAIADIDGLGPSAFRFYGPPDGTDTLYLRCPSDTSLGVQEIEADTDERLDALEAGGGGGGGAHPDLATHDTLGLATDAELATHAADTTAIHGIADTAALATSSSVTSAVTTHEAAANPHPTYATDTDLTAHDADTSVHGIADTSVLATDAEVTSAVSAHAAAADPHGDRAYADAVAQGLDVKAAVQVASTGNLTLSGEQTIDGVLTSASRVLAKNQAAGAENGIYVSAAGAWARATDADTGAKIDGGTFVFVESGTVNGGTGWAQTADPVTLGTTALVFSQFSSGGTIIGGAGLVKTGNTLDVGAGTGIAVAADTVGIAPGGVTNTQVDASAAIAESKLALNFPTHAEDHAARHAAAGADPLTGYATSANLATHEGAADPHQGYVLESAHTVGAHDTLGLVTDAILATHEADTTVVHGIADTSKVALKLAVTDRGLWVSTTGSDSNDGLSAGSAKLTVQAALDALSGNGGTVNVMGGDYTMTAELSFTAHDAKPFILRGMGSAYDGGATRFRWVSDLGSGKYGLKSNPIGSYSVSIIENIAFLGPNNFVTKGSFPANMTGIRLGRRVTVRDCLVKGFWAGIEVAIDHNRLERVHAVGNGFGLYWTTGAVETAKGDHVIYDCDLSGQYFASVGVKVGAALEHATWIHGHTGYSPYCFYFEGGASPSSLAMGQVNFFSTSFEASGNGMFHSPDRTARTVRVQFFGCSTPLRQGDQAISGVGFPAMIHLYSAENWYLDMSFPFSAGGHVPDDAIVFEVEALTNLRWCAIFMEEFQAAALALGLPLVRVAGSCTGNRWEGGSSEGWILSPSSTEAITAGQLVARSTVDTEQIRRYASAGRGATVLGVAMNDAPADTSAMQDKVIVCSRGRKVPVLGSGALAYRAAVMVNPANLNEITTYDGSLETFVGRGSVDGAASLGAGAFYTDIDLERLQQFTKRTVTGSRGGNAALADLLAELAALGLITDSSTA